MPEDACTYTNSNHKRDKRCWSRDFRHEWLAARKTSLEWRFREWMDFMLEAVYRIQPDNVSCLITLKGMRLQLLDLIMRRCGFDKWLISFYDCTLLYRMSHLQYIVWYYYLSYPLKKKLKEIFNIESKI